MITNRESTTIYLIDDQPTNLELLSICLRNQGYKVIIQEDGLIAITEVQKVLPDLILLDVLMPNIDGFEVCTRLKSIDCTKDIPIIFITALDEIEDKVKGLEIGAADYITKPLQLKELLSRINSCLKIEKLRQNLLEHNRLLAQEIKEKEKAQLALQESEQLIQTILDNNFNGTVIVDPEGNIIAINTEAEKIFRRKQEDIIGENLGIPLEFNKVTELDIPHLTQELTIVETRAIPIIWHKKNAYLISLIDVTEKKKMEEDLRILFEASEQSPASIVITNVNGNIEYVNPKFEQISGYSKEEVVGQNPRILKSGHTSQEEYRQLWASISQGKEWQGEFHNRRKNGEFYWEKALISPILNSAGVVTHFVAVKEDITQQKQQEVLLEYQAKYDFLTNIPNRNHALEKIEEFINQAQANHSQFALMFIDLDYFKEVNDNFGHDYGDELLIRATQRMKHNLRCTDFLARLGGDEFLVAIPFVKDKQDVNIIGAKILNSLEQLFKIFDVNVSISASIGIAFFPSDGDTLDKLINHADIAMFQAKKNGRRQLQFFEPLIDEIAKQEIDTKSHFIIKNDLDIDINQAIKNQEFKLVFQPIINLQNNAVNAVEVFLRWENPHSGLMYPDDFIPSIENSGMIFTLEKWLLQSIFSQSKIWQTLAKIPIHINLSIQEFYSLRIINTVKKFLVDNKFNDQDLVIEVKEQIFSIGDQQILEILAMINRLNIGISLDNFGCGVSSLTNLHKFPFQSLKIDTNLVTNLEYDPQARKLAQSIITVANLLKIKTIAQGIETPKQLKILNSLGCQYGQGYLFSKPLSSSEFNRYLINQKKFSFPTYQYSLLVS